MKHTKRIISILLAAMLALGLFVPSQAESPGDNPRIRLLSRKSEVDMHVLQTKKERARVGIHA